MHKRLGGFPQKYQKSGNLHGLCLRMTIQKNFSWFMMPISVIYQFSKQTIEIQHASLVIRKGPSFNCCPNTSNGIRFSFLRNYAYKHNAPSLFFILLLNINYLHICKHSRALMYSRWFVSLSGTFFSKAIFVPSISTYNKVTSGTSVIPSDISSKDLSWQFSLQRLWERIVHGIGTFIWLSECLYLFIIIIIVLHIWLPLPLINARKWWPKRLVFHKIVNKPHYAKSASLNWLLYCLLFFSLCIIGI